MSPCRIPVAHSGVLRAGASPVQESFPVTRTKALSQKLSPTSPLLQHHRFNQLGRTIDSLWTITNDEDWLRTENKVHQDQTGLFPTQSHLSISSKSPQLETSNHLGHHWLCHRPPKLAVSSAPLPAKMTTYAPSTKTIPSPRHSRDKHSQRALAEAQAAAEREVIEETDAWNDVSDDEEVSTVPTRQSVSSSQVAHANGIPSSQSISPIVPSSATLKSNLSGSGRGIWDLPSSSPSSSTHPVTSSRPTKIATASNHRSFSSSSQQASPSSSAIAHTGSQTLLSTSSPLPGFSQPQSTGLASFTALTASLSDTPPDPLHPIKPDFSELMRGE